MNNEQTCDKRLASPKFKMSRVLLGLSFSPEAVYLGCVIIYDSAKYMYLRPATALLTWPIIKEDLYSRSGFWTSKYGLWNALALLFTMLAYVYWNMTTLGPGYGAIGCMLEEEGLMFIRQSCCDVAAILLRYSIMLMALWWCSIYLQQYKSTEFYSCTVAMLYKYLCSLVEVFYYATLKCI